MKNLLTIAKYELKRVFRNPRLIVIVLSQPLVIPILVGLIFYQNPTNINVGVINNNKNIYSNEIVDKLKNNDKFNIIDYNGVDENEIKFGRVRAFIDIDVSSKNDDRKEIKIYNDPAGKVTGSVVESEVANIAGQVSKNIIKSDLSSEINEKIASIKEVLPSYLSKKVSEITVDNEAMDGIDVESSDATPFKLKFFDYYASAIIVLLIILVVLNLSGMSITGERISGTFERLFVTPYSKIEVMLGKALAQLLIGILIALLAMFSIYFIFSISIGNVFLVILINLLVGVSAVTLGLLISSITYSVVESVELAMYAFFISVMTTTIISPLETAHKYFIYIVKINPFYYAVDASRKVNMLNADWAQVSRDIYILVAFLVVFFILSVLLLKREAR